MITIKKLRLIPQIQMAQHTHFPRQGLCPSIRMLAVYGLVTPIIEETDSLSTP